MNHAPDDPLNQEGASFHNYMGKTCDKAACWKSTLAPIAKHVPVVTGEFDEDNFDQRRCGSAPSTFDATYLNWADSAGVSYLAWGWIVESQAEQDADGCSAFFLIDNYSSYTPARPNGVALHDHLRALATAGNPPPAVALTVFQPSVRPGNARVHVTLRSPQTCAGTITGTTVRAFAGAGGTHHRLSLDSVRVALTARTSGAAVLTLSRAFRAVLVARRSVLVQFTITLTSPHHRRTVIHRTTTLHAAAR